LFNCRSVRDEWNIFEGFGGSVIAQCILGIIILCQVLIVQFGGALMQTSPLSLAQWRACVTIGALSIPVGYLLKLIPASMLELRAIAPGGAAEAAAAPQSSDSEDNAREATTPGGSMRKRSSRKA
jgi:hypothetical protein